MLIFITNIQGMIHITQKRQYRLWLKRLCDIINTIFGQRMIKQRQKIFSLMVQPCEIVGNGSALN